jgi:hypothetical protein
LILTGRPAPHSGYETIHTLFPDRADVPEMCIAVNLYRKQEFLHGSGSLHSRQPVSFSWQHFLI